MTRFYLGAQRKKNNLHACPITCAMKYFLANL
jgi:hypothetical protein